MGTKVCLLGRISNYRRSKALPHHEEWRGNLRNSVPTKHWINPKCFGGKLTRRECRFQECEGNLIDFGVPPNRRGRICQFPVDRASRAALALAISAPVYPYSATNNRLWSPTWAYARAIPMFCDSPFGIALHGSSS